MKKPANQLFLSDMPEYYGLDSRTNYTAHENKTKLGIHPVFSHKKRVQLSQRNGFVSQHGCHFIVLEHQYSNHDAIVKMLYKEKSNQKKINTTSNSHPCPAESDLQFLEILHMFQFQYLNKVTPMIVELNFTYSKS